MPHFEDPAKVLDYLAIAVHEIAAISERRIERLTNPSLSGLPAFLVKEGVKQFLPDPKETFLKRAWTSHL